MVGIVANNLIGIKFKRTLGCRQFSLFRYGIDWITEAVFSGPYIKQNLDLLYALQFVSGSMVCDVKGGWTWN